MTTLAPSQDFKRVGDGDVGANTGGMGAYAPMGSLSSEQIDDIMERIVDARRYKNSSSAASTTAACSTPAIMLTIRGPKILEYNARFGDPETQVLVPLYGDGLFDLLLSVGEGRLRALIARRERRRRDGDPRVVTAIRSRPVGVTSSRASATTANSRRPWKASRSFTRAPRSTTTGRFVTNGGRVLAVTGVGESRRRGAPSRL